MTKNGSRPQDAHRPVTGETWMQVCALPLTDTVPPAPSCARLQMHRPAPLRPAAAGLPSFCPSLRGGPGGSREALLWACRLSPSRQPASPDSDTTVICLRTQLGFVELRWRATAQLSPPIPCLSVTQLEQADPVFSLSASVSSPGNRALWVVVGDSFLD